MVRDYSPFDDGNGRIARAIADLALARSEQSPQRFYSMSAQIRQERAAYYDILERTQKATMDITPWMEWFVPVSAAHRRRASYTWSCARQSALLGIIWRFLLNERQRLVLNRLLDGFDGKLTTSKWAKLAKCSHDTAFRDIRLLSNGASSSATPKAAAARATRSPRSSESCEEPWLTSMRAFKN